MPITVSKSLRKSVFEMSAEELYERIRPTAEKVTREAWGNNSYVTYFDELLCPSTDYMVHEYRDRKELVLVKENGEIQFSKIL
jgi:hypothetical protein